MARKRRSFTPDFKARAALEVLKGQRTLNEIAGDLGVHPVQLGQWKKQALDRLSELFSKPKNRGEEENDALLASLYQEIGQLKMELDWVKKKSGQLSARAARPR